MNYKALILTLALCLCIVPFVNAAHDYYPENKIVDTNPALSVPDPATYGYVTFSIIAGGAQDKTVWVLNKANVKAAPFDCKYNPDKSDIAGQNPDYTAIEVPGSGTTGLLPPFQAGSYVAYLQNGNGNQCERRDFTVGGASSSQATQVVFQGAAVSQLGEVDIGAQQSTCKLIIDSARYGICKGTPVEDHPGVMAKYSAWNPVRGALRPLINNGELHISASYPTLHYNGLFGDPYVGVFKKLIVRFHYDCGDNRCDNVNAEPGTRIAPSCQPVIKRVCVWEDEDLHITQNTENTMCGYDEDTPS